MGIKSLLDRVPALVERFLVEESEDMFAGVDGEEAAQRKALIGGCIAAVGKMHAPTSVKMTWLHKNDRFIVKLWLRENEQSAHTYTCDGATLVSALKGLRMALTLMAS